MFCFRGVLGYSSALGNLITSTSEVLRKYRLVVAGVKACTVVFIVVVISLFYENLTTVKNDGDSISKENLSSTPRLRFREPLAFSFEFQMVP